LRSSRAYVIGILVLFAAALAWAGGRGFRTPHLLDEHFAKHGHEFGQVTRDQYLHMAQQLRDSRVGKNILEAKRPGGGGAKFDRRFGWFVAYDGDGTIRTFFVPNEGIRYFERQGQTYGAHP
jgi:pyocin large subunit-like protein